MGTVWKDKLRAVKEGVCEFKPNYDFYFKWLTNKVASCFSIKGLSDTVNETYLKVHLLLDGMICVTDFNDNLYACIGGLGGQPDEYYIPRTFTIANPILGSKIVKISGEGKDGVLITNTDIDRLGWDVVTGGLFNLIHQTATLLADNIISISCAQINTRVVNIYKTNKKGAAVTAANTIKELYAGKPYAVIQDDIFDGFQLLPGSTASVNNRITELVELHNYIVANFFQSIGIKSNNVMKRERLISDEVEAQDDFLKVSLMEILTCWQKGFDEVNELYGTDWEVVLNPVLIEELLEGVLDGPTVDIPQESAVEMTETTQDETETETDEPTNDEVETNEQEVEPEPEVDLAEQIEEKEEMVADLVDVMLDKEEGELDVENEKPESTED